MKFNVSYNEMLEEASGRLEQLGMEPKNIGSFISKAARDYYDHGLFKQITSDYEKDILQVLEEVIQPYAVFVRDLNVKRLNLHNKKWNQGLSEEEEAEYEKANQAIEDYIDHAIPTLPVEEIIKIEWEYLKQSK